MDQVNTRVRKEVTNRFFYVCEDCHNVIYASRPIEPACCGNGLSPLPIRVVGGEYPVTREWADNEFYVHIDHPMTKSDYILFIAYVSDHRVQLIKLYPEQSAEVRFHRTAHTYLYSYSKATGLLLHLDS